VTASTQPSPGASAGGSPPVFQSIVKSTGIYSLAIIASKMSSFVLMPVYTRCLTPDNYGVLELLNLTLFVFSALIGVRFGDALFYFHSAAATEEERRENLSTAFLGAVLIGLLGGVLGFVLSPFFSQVVFGSPAYTAYFRVVFLAFAFSLPLDVGLCYLRVLDLSIRYVTVCTVHLACSIVSNIVLLVSLKMGVAGVLWGNVAANVLISGYLAFYLFSCIKPVFRWEAFYRQARYALPLGISGVGAFLIHFGDRFFLRGYVSLADIGIYSLAYKMGMLMTYVQMPFDTYWRSQMFSLVDGPGGARIFVRACTYLTMCLMAAFMLMSVWIHPLLRVMATPAFGSAAALVPWVAGAYVLRTIGGQIRCIFFIRKRTGLETIVTWIGSIVCLIGYVFLIPRFHLWGAVAATMAAFAVMLAVGLWQAQRVEHFHYEFGRMSIVAALAVAVVMLASVAAAATLPVQVAWGTLLTCLYVVIFLNGKILHPDETAELKSLALTAFQRLRGALA
jgi:O-antigen/teichoic acid export membrane protein